jgi:hypothetical protein
LPAAQLRAARAAQGAVARGQRGPEVGMSKHKKATRKDITPAAAAPSAPAPAGAPGAGS